MTKNEWREAVLDCKKGLLNKDDIYKLHDLSGNWLACYSRIGSPKDDRLEKLGIRFEHGWFKLKYSYNKYKDTTELEYIMDEIDRLERKLNF